MLIVISWKPTLIKIINLVIKNCDTPKKHVQTKVYHPIFLLSKFFYTRFDTSLNLNWFSVFISLFDALNIFFLSHRNMLSKLYISQVKLSVEFELIYTYFSSPYIIRAHFFSLNDFIPFSDSIDYLTALLKSIKTIKVFGTLW